ncbi:hypothetical protein AQ616_18265 [Oceanobacillus sp. E9]|uniref:hypothetical protein n=1 Tax=Oceanobacillus sp. E9 TaxID=1742575 RepID=UPI00084E6B59|nr:hypothetical protein [Oceanobacillus sp. E9]OEH52987.1 hypothetical protein AQ616_18265 [Oceanobacillus sp. E9]
MVKLQNKYLKDAAEFLQNVISTKGKKNLHRMRVVKVLLCQYEKVAEEEITLLKEYAKTDDQGEFVKNEAGGFDMDDYKGFNEQHKELFEEYFTLDDKNLEPALKTVEKLVNDFDKELSGKNAEMHYLLVEAFESNEGEGTDDE